MRETRIVKGSAFQSNDDLLSVLNKPGPIRSLQIMEASSTRRDARFGCFWVALLMVCLMGCVNAGLDSDPGEGSNSAQGEGQDSRGEGASLANLDNQTEADTSSSEGDVDQAREESNEATSDDAQTQTNQVIVPGPYKNPIVRVSLSEADWNALHEDVTADVEVPATADIYGEVYEIGFELQGYSARHLPKKGFKLKFGDDTPYVGNPFGDGGEDDVFDKLFLKGMYKDQSLIREFLGWSMLKLMGHHTPRVGWANLFINDEYWGLFVMVEPVDHDYIQRREYPENGNLYKAVRQNAGYDLDMVLEEAFEKKYPDDFEPWDDLEDLVERLQHTPIDGAAYHQEIDPIFSLQAYIERMMWVVYTQNIDAPRQNFYLYNTGTTAEPFWWLLPWDTDMCFSNHWDPKKTRYEVDWRHLLDGRNYFSRRLVQIDEIRHDYLDQLEALLTTIFTTENVMPYAEEAMERVMPDLLLDHVRWERSSSPDEEFGEITSFIEQRPGFLLETIPLFRDNPELPDIP